MAQRDTLGALANGRLWREELEKKKKKKKVSNLCGRTGV
jgi:hypothetical protein